jgi:hypothetical protein
MESSINRSKLIQLVADSYTVPELEGFLEDNFKLRLDHIVEPRGLSLIEVVRRVVNYFDRQGHLTDLVQELGHHRPGRIDILDLLEPSLPSRSQSVPTSVERSSQLPQADTNLAISPPRIFISHSSKDNDFGQQLTNDLRTILSDDSAVWYDQLGGLYGGEAWWLKIVKEIKERNIFLVILSPDAVNSGWVNDEIQMAWKQKNSRELSTNKLIIPVLYRLCDVPEFLTILQMVSFLPPKKYADA